MCVTSQLPLESIEEYLFGISTPTAAAAPLPSASASTSATSSNKASASAIHNNGQLSTSTVFPNSNTWIGGAQGQESGRAVLPALSHFKILSIQQEPPVDTLAPPIGDQQL